ncbi:hypothetical protein AK812_SmicGene6401 [Symbiodinium microadriaticum]|uniref:Hsp70 family protein n=1 Tax=Symbiodinium microadriaticum TaxID=2951 RepID=A0A1Q9ER70_SYMMI|nr:hypothetical protein AK812_SmicGene6401 [Symbiodinium microadriaticum]
MRHDDAGRRKHKPSWARLWPWLLLASAAPVGKLTEAFVRSGARPTRWQLARRAQETEGPAIGLDIGTTNSAVAVRREDGRFLVVPPPGRTI